MKRLLTTVFSIISFVVICQNINDLEIQKTELNSIKALFDLNKKNNDEYYDSLFTKIEIEKESLELVKSQLTKSQDSLNKLIELFGVSQSNLKIYHILKIEKIIDPNSKNFSKYSKKLYKAFNFSEDQKFLVISEFIYLEKVDKNGRISSLEKIKLSNDQIEKQNKLLIKNSISLLKENNLILENLTGVNSRYLILNDQLEDNNNRLAFINSELKRNILYRENIYKEYEQKKINIESEINDLTLSIHHIDEQITQINEQIAAETSKKINYSKFKTKNVNGIEVCITPLSVREFRNGEEIKKARTEGEWNKFNELNIPAYHFKDFDDNQANYGFIYNYHAITDNRELAPYGFHKLNLIDFNYLENQLLFTDTKLVDCYCGNGKESISKSCTNCNFWTATQRKYNVCSKCQNLRYYNTGTKKCSICNGTKKVKACNMEDRRFCVFPTSNNSVEYFFNPNTYSKVDDNLLGVATISFDGEFRLESHSTKDLDIYYHGPVINYKAQGYQVLICKDKNFIFTNDFDYTSIGDIDLMNSYLTVTKFSNGDPIKYIEDPIEWELALKNKVPAYCYYNNQNDGTGCIYNIHAWNDRRGLIPNGWRSLKPYDIEILSCSTNSLFTLNSASSPLKYPKGTRNINGIFEEKLVQEYFFSSQKKTRENYFEQLNFKFNEYHDEGLTSGIYLGGVNKSGYVLCVREANKNNIIQKEVNVDFQKELESKSVLIKKVDDVIPIRVINSIKSYNEFYNEKGVAAIKNAALNNFSSLFKDNNKIKLLCMKVRSDCEENVINYTGNDGDFIYGIIIDKIEEKKILCSIIQVSTSPYNEWDGHVKEFQNMLFKKTDELIYNNDTFGDLELSFIPFDCNSSNNPLENFHVKFKYKCYGFEGDWSEKLSIYYGSGHHSKVEWAIDQVMDFLNTH